MIKIKIYTTDENFILNGEVEIDSFSSLPPNSTALQPPIAEFVQLQGTKWVVLDSYPVKVNNQYDCPTQVTMRQARLELLNRGLLDDVEAVISAQGRAAQIEWEYAATVDRSHPVIAVVQQQKEMTDLQIDDLFIAASKL